MHILDIDAIEKAKTLTRRKVQLLFAMSWLIMDLTLTLIILWLLIAEHNRQQRIEKFVTPGRTCTCCTK